MDEIAVSVREVSKCYKVFESQRARLRHALWPRHRDGMQEVWALRDIDFEVRRGESVAVIGRNGGGKSTLLQILTGTLAPSAGRVAVRGRVCALLELGSGFNPEYTGRDNVILNGLLLGLSREEILRRFDEIAAFAEIGEAIDRPVKTYSSGMVMRLAFAVQVLTDPEILIVDEALSVGDFFFQQKCFSYIRALCARGVTLLFVSHDMGTVRDLCSRAIYLKEGRLQFAGETTEAIRRYLSERHSGIPVPPTASDTSDLAGEDDVEKVVRDGLWRGARGTSEAGPGQLIAVAIYDSAGRPATNFKLGDTVTLKVVYRPAKERHPTHVAVVIRNKYDQVVSSLGSSRLALNPPEYEAAPNVIFEMSLRLMVEAGNYSVTVTLSRLVAPNQGSTVDSSPALGPIVVKWDYERDDAPFLGMVGLPSAGMFKLARATGEVSHDAQ